VVVSRPADKKFVVLKKCWVVERTFAWMGWNRRSSKDYVRTAICADPAFEAYGISLIW
jgi:transposase